MPYIKPEQRSDIDSLVDTLSTKINDAGTLNYAVSRLTHKIVNEKGLSYSKLNELIGALECIKLELYRKIAAPYEDKKLFENGPIGILDIESLIPQSVTIDFIKAMQSKREQDASKVTPVKY